MKALFPGYLANYKLLQGRHSGILHTPNQFTGPKPRPMDDKVTPHPVQEFPQQVYFLETETNWILFTLASLAL